eukprot:366025-Chlamydomonas_euryale.AAC.6
MKQVRFCTCLAVVQALFMQMATGTMHDSSMLNIEVPNADAVVAAILQEKKNSEKNLRQAGNVPPLPDGMICRAMDACE